MQLNAKNVRGNPIREHLSIVSGSPIMYHFVLSAFSGNVFVSPPRESVSAWLNTRFRAAPRRGEHFGPNTERSSLFSSLSLGKIKHTVITNNMLKWFYLLSIWISQLLLSSLLPLSVVYFFTYMYSHLLIQQLLNNRLLSYYSFVRI